MKQKPKYNMWQNSLYMVSLAWKVSKIVLLWAAAQVILGVLSDLLGLYMVPVVLDTITAAERLSRLLSVILALTLCQLLLGAGSAYVDNNVLFGRVHVRSSLITRIHKKFCTTSYPNIEDPEYLKRAEKAFQVVSANNQAAEAIWDTLVKLLNNGISLLIYFALLVFMHPAILILMIITSFAGFYAEKYINEWRYRHREEEAGYSQKLNYIINKSGNYRFAKDLRIFGMKDWLDELYHRTLRLYQDFCAKSEWICLGADALEAVFSLLRNGIAYGYLIWMAVEGRLGAAQFMLYFSAAGGLASRIGGILSDLNKLHKQSLDLSLVREFLEEKEPFCFEEGEALAPDMDGEYTLALKDVHFQYPGQEKETLSGIDLTIRPGEKLAIVGLNGAGKTTLIKLLCGFLDPTRGQVLLNGQDIRRYNRRDYYRLFAAVFQQFFLLAGNIEENVAQRDGGIDRKRLEHCIEMAGLTEKVSSLPQGYDTKLVKSVYEDAVELSGGEKQRLMLARALYKEAPILVLDEPTAALDPIAENDIYQKYRQLTRGRTSVYISHRLASTRFCDRIILLENGVIAEEGTHEELIAKGGSYAGLFEIQKKYYQEGGARNEEE